jgi:Raf kinase inhibitor-like YbhB/YbcL family protein
MRMTMRIGAVVGAGLLAWGAGACAVGTGRGALAAPGVTVASMTVTSKSIPSGGQVPVDATCDGKDTSPELTWSAPPEGTRAIAIVMDDSDAPGATFTHWLVLDLPPSTVGVPEGVEPSALGARTGTNDFDSARYAGPCPPRGQLHRYEIRVLALDAPSGARDGAKRAVFDAAIRGHVLGQGTLETAFGH